MELGGYLRQCPIVLQLIFHPSQLLDDAFALFDFFIISNRANGSMEIIYRARLVMILAIGSRLVASYARE